MSTRPYSLAGLLVLIVIMVFLQNWRATLVPATTVPVTIIGAFAAMLMLGFSINLMTLFALILAIGIVVDDAIVIVENASYHIEQGLPPKEATIKAMEEMTGPVFGITLALVSVFLPAAFLPGITGQLFRQFALVIAATAVISAINALTLKPAQCALWLRPRREKKPNAFFRGFNRVYGVMEQAYVGLVSRMVQRPRLTLLVFVVIIAVSGWQFARHPTGFLPTDDQGYAIVITKLPDAASQPRVQAAVKKLNGIIKKTKGIAAWVTFGGFSLLDNANVSNIATTFIVYDDWDKRGAALSQDKILANLRGRGGHREGGDHLCAGAASHPGAGSIGRFPDDGGGPGKPRAASPAKERPGDHQCRQFPVGLAQPEHHFQRPQPPALSGHRPDQGRIPANPPGQCL